MDSEYGESIAALQASLPRLRAYDPAAFAEYVPYWTELWLTHVYRVPITATQLHRTACATFRVVEEKANEFLQNAKDEPAAMRAWCTEVCAAGVVVDLSDREGSWRSYDDILQDARDWFASGIF